MNNISVIMSAYNSQNSIKDSIKSVLGQTYGNFEFLILDDGSSDDTEKIIKDYANKDKRIKFFKNNKNLGLTKSLNILIGTSKGNIIARQDADDISKKERFEHQIKYIDKNNLDGCTSLAISKQTQKKINILKSYLPLELVVKYRNPFIHGSLMLKKETFNNINNYDENFIYAQDYKLMTDLLKKNYKIKILKKVLYVLNTSNNISTNMRKEQDYYAKCVQKSAVPYLKK